eukprot:TRINITY_DN40121_c0_g1_i1.p1 TRINITY_DN40121_c0_g1~~TRINITY_DN40121_c0_g1_i1.p1  ORF type:complete len:261 (-),score=55.40 TRINITY_DN40121_c0_g1_i1:234-1016(-)
MCIRDSVCRHGERQDHVTPEWAASSSRPHDSPLSATGLQQAEELGQYLSAQLEGVVPRIFVSPLVRTVQTATHIAVGMNYLEAPLMIEQGLCEAIQYLRPRMLGIHDNTVLPPAGFGVPPNVEGAPRGVTQPVLLESGDLVSLWPHLQLGYKSACAVTHDPTTGFEVNPVSGEQCSSEERVLRAKDLFLDQLQWDQDQDQAVLCVTHGTVGCKFVQAVVGCEDMASLSYTEMIELEHNEGEWKVIQRWKPQDAGGAYQNA